MTDRKVTAITHRDVLAESARQDDGTWRHSCGTDLVSAGVLHPVHDGPFPLSGFGNVYRQVVAYCPACHEKPGESGRPVKPGDEIPAAPIRLLDNGSDVQHNHLALPPGQDCPACSDNGRSEP